MDPIEIKPLERLVAEIEAPPSKAHTLRALFIASLADGCSTLSNLLIADDQERAIDSLRNLGVDIDLGDEVKIYGLNGRLRPKKTDIYIGGSGATARILTVVGALSEKEIVMDGNSRMQTGRPLQDLIDAIKPLGIDAVSLRNNGCVPIRIRPGFKGGKAPLKGSISSQYFTAIMIAAPYAKDEVTILTQGDLVSKPYIDITIQMMRDFGVEVKNEDYQKFTIHSGQNYFAREYRIEGDYSSASFFFEAAAITQGRVKVKGLNPNSAQGDKYFVRLLEQMGCEVITGDDFVEVIGRPLRGIRVDMKDYPDIVTPLAVTAAFAEGRSEFYNISHLQYKECDRLQAPVAELQKMGVDAFCTSDSIVINGGSPNCAEIETYGDHRMVMGFAPAGLKVPGVIIKNPKNVEKSFPDFFEKFEQLYR